jgi:hypothetical protein
MNREFGGYGEWNGRQVKVLITFDDGLPLNVSVVQVVFRLAVALVLLHILVPRVLTISGLPAQVSAPSSTSVRYLRFLRNH